MVALPRRIAEENSSETDPTPGYPLMITTAIDIMALRRRRSKMTRRWLQVATETKKMSFVHLNLGKLNELVSR